MSAHGLEGLHVTTRLTALGRDPFSNDGVVSPPVYHVSTILFKSYRAFMDGKAGKSPHTTYGRYGTRSTLDFAATLANLCGAEGAMLTSSGMAAIAVAIMAVVKSGDHLLMVDTCYDPARRFCDQELTRMGVEVTYYAPCATQEELEALWQLNTRAIFAESPGSLTFEVQDVPMLAALAHRKDALVILDNTYAAPLLNQPFTLGADVVLFSASKYISGHSDLVMGVVCGTAQTLPMIRRAHYNYGPCPGPDDVYLAQRGLRSLGARMQQHQRSAREVAAWLKTLPEVSRVLHPEHEDCPGHAIFKRDFNGPNGLFSVVLNTADEAKLSALLDGLKLFGMGYSWGGYESLIIPCPLKSIRSCVEVPEGSTVLRINIGLEHTADLISDLRQGFERLRVA